MKRFLALSLLLAGLAPVLRAQTPDAEFLQIYGRMEEGEALEQTGQLGKAIDRFHEARVDLERFAKTHPDWNRTIVSFRLGYLGQKLGNLKEHFATSQAPPPTSSAPSAVASGLVDARAAPGPQPAVVASQPAGGLPPDALALARRQASQAEARASAAEAKAEAAQLEADRATALANEFRDRSAQLALDLQKTRERVELLEAAQKNLERTRDRLERDRSTLQAKLNEALSPRPAGLDPAALARSEERNRLLVMENDVLKACLDRQLVESKQTLENARKAAEFESELKAMRTELDKTRQEADGLRDERQKLHARLESAGRKRDEATAAVQRELDSVRNDLAAARRVAAPARDDEREMSALRVALADEKADNDKLRRENGGLRREVERVAGIRFTPASLKVAEVAADDVAFADVARIRRLERERDELRRQLEAARVSLPRSDAAPVDSQPPALIQRIEQLEANLKVLTAQREPYSEEELALFDSAARREALRPLQLAQATAAPANPVPPPVDVAQPPQVVTNAPPPEARPATAPVLPAPSTTPAAPPKPIEAPVVAGTNAPAGVKGPAGPTHRRTIEDLPPGAGLLARQAERAFMLHRLDEAEKTYREILEMDRNNVYTLGNLGMILVEANKMPEAEAMVKRAQELDPEDPFTLSLLGLIRFRQHRYDDAFDALSRSAKLDPENSETFNYLGITLSERGDRKAAEAALRKAVTLNPNSAMAHYNLAVVYATETPPFLDLARFHYQKARRAGQPANPDFERLLNGEAAGTPAKTP